VRVTLLSGGGGGARFARGLAGVLAPGELTVVGNVGDDLEILGLHVSPDLDSLLYTLSGLIDAERGWGRADETWNALESAASFGGEDWFRLGDRDIGLHLVRTRALREGVSLSDLTARLTGRFSFQEWFVGRRHADDVDAVEYDGASGAKPAPGVLEALAEADAIVLAPSNPYLSIGPILAVDAIREAIRSRQPRCVAVSPLVGGAAVTGPLDRMLTRMAGGASPRHVASCYAGLIDALVIDESDAPAEADLELVVAQTLMRTNEDERRLAEVVLELVCV
jgi:LPPG:FO 2-phospho-L-lactate transferase